MDGELLQFLSPLGWEHINLTGDYVCGRAADWKTGSFGPGCPENLSVRFFRILRAPYLICARQNVKTAARTSPASAGRTRPRGPCHGPRATPQQERQKAAREAERGREAWTQAGHEKARSGCYGRLTRWKGEGCCPWLCCSEWVAPGSGPDQSSPFLGPSTFLTTSLLFANPSTITASPARTLRPDRLRRRRLSRPATAARAEPVQRCRRAAIAVAGLLLARPNSEVADCHQRIDGVPGRKTRLAEAKLRVDVSICGAPIACRMDARHRGRRAAPA